jgi:hypothetical protein
MSDRSKTVPPPAATVEPLERETIRRVAWRLMPLLMLGYFCAYLDRVNVGFAGLTMIKALGFSGAVFGFGAGVFFVGYFLAELPSNLILARVGARRFQIDRDGLVEVGLGEVIEASDQGDAGIVDQDVDGAELVVGLLDHGGDGLAVGDVGGDGDGIAALGFDGIGDRGGLVGSVAVVDGDVGAGICEGQRDGGADAAGSAGDEGGAIGQGHGRSYG